MCVYKSITTPALASLRGGWCSAPLLMAGPAGAAGVMFLPYGAAGLGEVLGGLMPQGTDPKQCRSAQGDTAKSCPELPPGARQQPGWGLPQGQGQCLPRETCPAGGPEPPRPPPGGRRAKRPVPIKGRGKRKGAWESFFSCNLYVFL